MSLMPSLCAALERVGGERLVMRAGERPHVLAGDRRHDVASAILSVNAVEALAEQILSLDSRRELREKGTASETIQAASFPHPLMAKAERVGDEFSIELVVHKPGTKLEPEPPVSEPDPVVAEVTEVAAVEPQPEGEPEPEPVRSNVTCMSGDAGRGAATTRLANAVNISAASAASVRRTRPNCASALIVPPPL
jgi:hypothetical protein